MRIKWRYGQVIEIIEYDLYKEMIVFKCIENGANWENLNENEIYQVDFSKCNGIPDIPRVIELIEEQYDIYLGD